MYHRGTVELETERLILRKFRQEDAQDMFDNWANDKNVTKHLSWLPHGSVDCTKKCLEAWITGYEKDSMYQWAIVPKEYGKVIGSVSAMNVNEKDSRCGIGYCMSKSYWNKGIMTEALKTVIKFLFYQVGFNRIQAMHHVENPASGKVMQKVGMKYEGRLKQYHVNNCGEYVDCDIYAIVKNDYIINKGNFENSDTALYKIMYEKESSHLNQEIRRSADNMAMLLADDFIEFQSSGGVINKQQVLDALYTETEWDIKYKITDFKSKLLSDRVVLNTYRIKKVSAKGEEINRTLRSSIWKYEDGRWQLLFHQGTITNL